MTPQEQARRELYRVVRGIWKHSSSVELRRHILEDPAAFSLVDFLEIFDPDFDYNSWVTCFMRYHYQFYTEYKKGEFPKGWL